MAVLALWLLSLKPFFCTRASFSLSIFYVLDLCSFKDDAQDGHMSPFNLYQLLLLHHIISLSPLLAIVIMN